jgi:RNA-binding protein YhbY
MPTIRQIQLGKNGLTENLILNLKHHFETCKNVKISVLKSCCRDREELKQINAQILQKMGSHYTSRIIGYTIVVKRWRKDMNKDVKGDSHEPNAL